MKKRATIGIVGNPNSGKTCLFNAITGGKARVGNWPGVTVERKIGTFNHLGEQIEVVDLPGIYSLSTASLDEQIARDYILKERPDLVINILDASNLERNLYLTVQLIEMKTPLIVVLNMMDLVKQKNLKIKVQDLSRMLDCPIVCTVAHKRNGIEELKDCINNALDNRHISSASIYFPDEVEEAVKNVASVIKIKENREIRDERWTAIKLLEGDIDFEGINNSVGIEGIIASSKQKVHEILGEDTDIIIAESRYGFINSVCKKVIDKTNILRKNASDFIDKIVLNRILGIPIFLISMYLTFWITINFGGCFIDFFDVFFGTIFVDGFGSALDKIGVPVFLKSLLAGGIGGGIQTISTFIPPIFFIFLCLAVLEDSGYMARAAFVMDRAMRAVGLPGKAFVPMLVGFGCNVPAIMATRTLEHERDRILTVMINPFMSCGARVPVYALFAAAFFPNAGGTIVFALYMIGIALAIITAFILKGTILKGETSTFIMELPPYHIPTFKGILIHTWERLKTFILRAGKVILAVIVILSFLNSIGTDGSFGNQDGENSVLSKIGKMIVPVLKPMGMREDNWPAAVGIFTGIFAKEAVIGTLDSLYSQIDIKEKKGTEPDKFNFFEGMKESFATIPENLSGLSLPFSLTGLIGSDVDSAIEDLEVEEATYSSLVKRFDGKAGAFAYLLMILLYMPCVAAIAAVYRELSLGWTIFSAAYLSGLAWLLSTLFYQVMRFNQHPGISAVWIIFCILIFSIFVAALKRRGNVLLR